MPSTAELVNAARAGDKSAFGQLVRLYERAAILTAYAQLHDYHAAQDAAQDAFLNAYTNLNQLREAAAFGPWLLQLVRRRATLVQKTLRPEPFDAEPGLTAAGGSPDWLQRYEEVVQQLAKLPEHERTVMVLRYVDGRSVQEIAETLGKPADTVRKQLSRAVERLRTFFRKVLA